VLIKLKLPLVFLICLTAAASDRQAVFGRWADDRTILEISEGQAGLSAKVVAIKDPVYTREENLGVPGQPRVDLSNPDAALRDRPLLGLDLLTDYEFADGKWQGRIYDPESGKTYSSYMKIDKGLLTMRGYIGLPLLGRTAEFVPVNSCTDLIVEMLRIAQLFGNCGLEQQTTSP